VSNVAGSHGDPRFGLAAAAAVTSYAVSKAALNALTVKLALELREDGILVNAVCPGLTATTRDLEEVGARPVEEVPRAWCGRRRCERGGADGGFFRDGPQEAMGEFTAMWIFDRRWAYKVRLAG
jgi:NAD(P)-dependent dehydrogenase (short-subunit alcohol dehydrogenase family)